MDEIDRRFNEDKPALATYNLQDCELVTRIFHKTEIMPFLLERATVNGLPADRHGGSVAAFSHLYFPRMHRLGYVAPNWAKCRRRPVPAVTSWTRAPVSMIRCWFWIIKPLPFDYPHLLIDPVGLIEGMAPGQCAQHRGFSRRPFLAAEPLSAGDCRANLARPR